MTGMYPAGSRNLLKRDPTNVVVAICTLCNMEDQQHITWSCTQHNMQEFRQHHLEHIQSELDQDLIASNTTTTRSKINTMLADHTNWEQLLGRVHSHSRPLIESLPTN